MMTTYQPRRAEAGGRGWEQDFGVKQGTSTCRALKGVTVWTEHD